MSREQIEEMAWDLCDIPKHPSIKSCEQCGNKHCHALYYAERAYNAGYRKQEWISVEERLPEADTDVLVITCHGSFKVARCNIYHNGTLVLWMTNDGLGEKAIAHWMPLPEPPKMKGGAE